MKILKLLVLPVFLFSFELKFEKKFKHELPHDTLTTNIRITIDDDRENRVEQRLNVFNEKIKRFDKVEKKFIGFSVRPKYRHAMNTPKVNGYIGELRYKVYSYKAKHMDEFISELTKLKRNRDTEVSLTNLAWSVPEDTYNVTFDLLRLQAINWGINYIKNVSNDIEKECNLKSIEIDKENELMSANTGKVYTTNNIKEKVIPIPDTKQENIVIFANYVMECR